MPYWIASTLAATPAFVWVVVGLGVPWALAALPRKDWRDRPLVLCLALALGPALLTAWMFVLGTLGATQQAALIRFDLVFGGTVALALVGAAIAWRKRTSPPDSLPRKPLAWDEKLLVALILVALVIRWFDSAYWPFTAYDALWVYGYQGRLYALLGYIPQTIGYYPPFLSLYYTFGQLAVGGIDDHAARAGLLLLQIGSILAVYVLGSRLFTRRAGIIAAALWTLYPHVGEWSRFGDLEIALTFAFTLAAAFFLIAWTGQQPRRRYAVLAGVVFGIAMWTKPTAGAFVWGVLLLLGVEFVRVRGDVRAWLPRFEVAVITGLASIPLGGVWYARNILLGHNPIDLPPSFWQTLAAQSGAEFGWLLLALVVALAYLYVGRRGQRPNRRHGLLGVALVLAGVLPSILNPHRMTPPEWLALGAGIVVLYRAVSVHAPAHWSDTMRDTAARLGWALALALPYFVTWFVSYSYHYRLSFAIVPLMILPTAVVVARWLKPDFFAVGARRPLLAAILIVASLPALLAPLYDTYAGWDWLWTDKLPDDTARYTSGNPALMNVVQGLDIYLDEHDAPLVVVAPGVKRLPFFFPLADIRIDDAPTTFEQLEGVVYFIDSHPEGTGAYEGIPVLGNQVLSALERHDLMRLAWGRDDGIFRYHVYELHLDQRFVKTGIHVDPRADVVFGDFARFLGHDLGGDTLWDGRELTMHLYWEVLTPAPEDYTIYIHVRDIEGNVVAAWDAPVARSADSTRYYSTLVWEPKELITDERILEYTSAGAPPGDEYRIVIGMYDPLTNERVPITINGKEVRDGFQLNEEIKIVAEAPS